MTSTITKHESTKDESTKDESPNNKAGSAKSDPNSPDENPAAAVRPLDPVIDDNMSPAQRDVDNPPINDSEAQAQAHAVDASTGRPDQLAEPIAAPAEVHDMSFEDIAAQAVSSALATNELEMLNKRNTEIRLAIANRFPNLTVQHVQLRARRDEGKDGKAGPLVVEVRQAHGDWQSVPYER